MLTVAKVTAPLRAVELDAVVAAGVADRGAVKLKVAVDRR